MNPSSLFNQLGTVTRRTSLDKYGRPTFGSATQYQCRVQLKRKTLFLANGQVVTILGIVYLPRDASVAVDDRFSYAGVDYTVFGREEAVDGQGNVNHIKIEIT